MTVTLDGVLRKTDKPADTHAAGRIGQPGSGAGGPVGCVEDPAGMWQERLPVRGEGDLAAKAVEQCQPKLAFQPGYLLADGIPDVRQDHLCR